MWARQQRGQRLLFPLRHATFAHCESGFNTKQCRDSTPCCCQGLQQSEQGCLRCAGPICQPWLPDLCFDKIRPTLRAHQPVQALCATLFHHCLSKHNLPHGHAAKLHAVLRRTPFQPRCSSGNLPSPLFRLPDCGSLINMNYFGYCGGMIIHTKLLISHIAKCLPEL